MFSSNRLRQAFVLGLAIAISGLTLAQGRSGAGAGGGPAGGGPAGGPTGAPRSSVPSPPSTPSNQGRGPADVPASQNRDVPGNRSGAPGSSAAGDQLLVRDRDQLRNRDIFGSELMTRGERNEYRERIAAMTSVQEWARFKAEHQTDMLARARERGVDLPRPLYGQQLMTDQEREQLQQRLNAAGTEQARRQIEAEHRELVQQRARAYGIPLSALGDE
jgi:hypothetical protein